MTVHDVEVAASADPGDASAKGVSPDAGERAPPTRADVLRLLHDERRSAVADADQRPRIAESVARWAHAASGAGDAVAPSVDARAVRTRYHHIPPLAGGALAPGAIKW